MNIRRKQYLPAIVVTGGRDYADQEFLYSYMDSIAFLYGGDIILVTGACPTGADYWAERWAKDREHIYCGIPAQWSKYGKRAGPKRNGEIGVVRPDGVVVFPGDMGTLNMLSIATNMEPKPKIHLPHGEFWK